MTRQHAHRPQPYPRVTWRTIARWAVGAVVVVAVVIVLIAWTAVTV